MLPPKRGTSISNRIDRYPTSLRLSKRRVLGRVLDKIGQKPCVFAKLRYSQKHIRSVRQSISFPVNASPIFEARVDT